MSPMKRKEWLNIRQKEMGRTQKDEGKDRKRSCDEKHQYGTRRAEDRVKQGS